jgi:hypothetical protein
MYVRISCVYDLLVASFSFLLVWIIYSTCHFQARESSASYRKLIFTMERTLRSTSHELIFVSLIWKNLVILGLTDFYWGLAGWTDILSCCDFCSWLECLTFPGVEEIAEIEWMMWFYFHVPQSWSKMFYCNCSETILEIPWHLNLFPCILFVKPCRVELKF